MPSPVPISLVNHSLAVAFGGRWWTALNTGVFNRLWQEALHETRRQSGVNRGQREHKGSFRGYDIPPKGVERYFLDSCLLLSSFFA